MEKLEIRQYESFDVSFLLTSRNVKVNATEMARIYSKRVKDFMNNEGTKAFIKALIRTPKSVRLGIESEADVYENKGRNGMWMHRVLALKFASWLNSDFEVWVYITIDEFMFGQLPELAQEEIIAEKAVEDTEAAMKSTPEYQAHQAALDFKKKVVKSIKNEQSNQMNIFK